MDAFGLQSPGFVPGHEHDEGVAGHGLQPAVLLGLAIDRAIGVRPAVDRQVDLAPYDAVHRAPARVDAVEVGLEVGDRRRQRRAGVGGGALVAPGLGDRRGHGDGQGRRPFADGHAPVPAREKALGGGDVGVALGIEAQHQLDHLGHVRPVAVGDVVFVGAEGGGGDVRIGAEGLLGAVGPVGHVGLDAHGRREVGRLQGVLRTCGLERGVVGVEHIAGLGIPDLGHAVEGQVAGPDQVRPVARQLAAPVDPGLPIGEQAVVDIADVPGLVGVDVVDAGQGLQGHGGAPLGEGPGLIEAVILQRLARLAHAGVADGEHAVVGLHHRPVG